MNYYDQYVRFTWIHKYVQIPIGGFLMTVESNKIEFEVMNDTYYNKVNNFIISQAKRVCLLSEN